MTRGKAAAGSLRPGPHGCNPMSSTEHNCVVLIRRNIFRFRGIQWRDERVMRQRVPRYDSLAEEQAPLAMRLLAVNVALPKTIVVDGESISTGIFKKPVKGPVRIEKLNLQGDQQADLAVHGGPDKAVYAYSWENIVYWQQTLHRDDLRPGSFGENLTVQGLLETEVAIGDELAIGSARFQVTQPRIPCFKLSAAIGAPGFQKQFLESGRTGFYLRVLEEGTVEAGDLITVTGNQERERVSVDEITRAVRSRTTTEIQLRRILALEALPGSLRAWLERKVQKLPGDGAAHAYR